MDIDTTEEQNPEETKTEETNETSEANEANEPNASKNPEEVKRFHQMQEIEGRLNKLIAGDKKSWVEVYELMDLVEKENLYVGMYRSYTAWVNSLAASNHVHVSTLWSRKKAGKVYAEYMQRAAQQGKTVPSLSEANIPPDNLNLIAKIAGSNTEVADDLIHKSATSSELSRQDLRDAWATVKANQGTMVRKTRHDSREKVSANAITSGDIVLALSHNRDWVPDQVPPDEKEHEVENYKILTEFAVRTGSSRHARRIDALVLENLSEKVKKYHLCIHAVEVKVDKDDLLNDKKMQEYYDFADRFWLAVTEELEEDAKQIMIDGWGLLVFKFHNSGMANAENRKNEEAKTAEIRVAIQAKKDPGVLRDQTIESALITMI